MAMLGLTSEKQSSSKANVGAHWHRSPSWLIMRLGTSAGTWGGVLSSGWQAKKAELYPLNQHHPPSWLLSQARRAGHAAG